MPAEKTSKEKKPARRRTKKAVEDEAVVNAETVEESKDVEPAAEDVKPETESKEETAVETKASETEDTEDLPDVPENERIHRYDVMITSERPGYRPPRAAFGAMIQQIAFRGLASPVDEAVAETWVEVYFEPGPTAQDIFCLKGYDSDEPVFKELVVRSQEKAFFCDYSETPNRPLYWCIEIRGSRFPNPLGSFKKLFLDAFNVRVTVASHDAEPIPPHRVVPEDELPSEKKKRERGAGLAGTEVEEM
ncbi:MAG: hypothetical protein IJU23_07995 [Proteobacteria bacterium]|nr:hypothetical protein [Pseudomonadota bacterium]